VRTEVALQLTEGWVGVSRAFAAAVRHNIVPAHGSKVRAAPLFPQQLVDLPHLPHMSHSPEAAAACCGHTQLAAMEVTTAVGRCCSCLKDTEFTRIVAVTLHCPADQREVRAGVRGDQAGPAVCV